MEQFREGTAWRLPGFPVLVIEIALVVWLVLGEHSVSGLVLALGSIAAILLAAGFFVVQPNEARVVIFFGRYAGSMRRAGFHWTNPLTVRRRVSLRVRNFSSDKLKVNDAAGNPVEIAAVIVWRVVDSAKALFDVEEYAAFVAVQSETAIRALASRYPYDSAGAEISLLGSPDELAIDLRQELETRLAVAGVEILEARLTHLAYAPEIAQAMLRRQQAQAIVTARQKIVEGAVGMVRMALEEIAEANIVEFDEERKATMVNNLMVVLTSDQATQPIVNTGTLYA
jgi:regulator of protease activity HflC (stomatin/prohibitin superfamily)